ncbi:MAG: ABC transporter ATP-binding protein [Microbacterium sp.]|nr:ABC transporter ATP-binding protein [Microbacterium sp.]
MIRTVRSLLPDSARPRLGAYAAASVVSVVLRAVGAVLFVPLLSALFGAAPSDALVWVAALTVATVLGWAVDAFAARLGFALGFGMLDNAQRTVAERISRIRLTWFTADNTATARQAIAATGPDLVGLFIYLFTPLLSALLLPVAIGLALLPVAWPLGVAALLGTPILLAAMWASARLSRRADRAASDANAAVTERILEFARTQSALRAARRADSARSLAGDALQAQHSSVLRLVLMQVPGQILFSIAAQLALVLLAGTTVVLAARGGIDAPQAVALIVVIVRYLEPMTVLATLSPALESTLAVIERIRTVLDAPVDGHGPGTSEATTAPHIEFRGVSFGYGDTQVLHDLDLVIEAGSSTAIVGPSGSGKSTVLALIAGLHAPDAGSILVDGVDASSLDAETRRRLVSAVFQETALVDGTIDDNVRVGDPEAPAHAVEGALRAARADGIAARLGRGKVGERGAALSGGERQRVSIARALVKRAPILLIDEATSALDTENEAAVVDALHSASDRTRVVVAHRYASIAGCDRVVFLDGGRVVEQGGVDELRRAGGRFAAFWREQGESGAWRLRASRSEA